MMHEFHFLRPEWFLLLIPIIIGFWRLRRVNPELHSWSAVCDKHLLEQLVRYSGKTKRHQALATLFISILFIILSLAGPSWSKYPVPSYQLIQPRVIVLDLSTAMLAHDLAPDRLTRAKFKLHDLFQESNSGQLGLIVFTGEPFVVSPLTDDAKTIDALLETMTPDIMPVDGYRLDLALEEAVKLIQQAGFNQGQILVLTAETPNAAAINIAANWAKHNIITSVMPIRANNNTNNNVLFERLASAGNGMLLNFSDNSTHQFDQWLNLRNTKQNRYLNQRDNVPIWRDEGRWFLIPSLIFMLPVFRRGWLQRVVL